MAAAGDPRIIGIKVRSRQAAHDALDQLDEKVHVGQVTIREEAIVYKTAWPGRAGGGRTVATGGALLPVFLGSTIVDLALGSTAADLATVGMGAAIGHTVEKHRRQVSKDFLKAIGDSVQAGGAAVLVACDPVTGRSCSPMPLPTTPISNASTYPRANSKS